MRPLEGDVTLPEFGLSPRDVQFLVDNVSVVFNLAATVRFDEPLKTAVALNVAGPRKLLALCRKMEKLEVSFFIINIYYSSPMR